MKLVDVVGLATARRMVLTGVTLSGPDLDRCGLVTATLPDTAGMRAAAMSAAREMAVAAPLSLRAAKASFFELARRDAPPDLDRARRLADACYDSADYAEGRAARRQKRTPQFKGI